MPPPITQAEVDKLLQAWLDAQNAGEFSAYERLYATKFFGVKRVGERVKRFDRAGWLADRKRMFQKPISVDASETQLSSVAGTATLTFTQRWISGKFEDKGRKRLLIMREGDQLKIAQEELLDSQVLASAALDGALETFHFALAYQSGLYLAMPEQALVATTATARRESPIVTQGIQSASRAVPDDILSASLASWKGRRVKLDDGCVGTVAEIRVLSRVLDGFETLQAEEKLGAEGKVADAELAEMIFSLGEAFMVARVEGCKLGEYARPEDALPPMAAEQLDDPALSARARAAFAALPSVQELQHEFAKHPESGSGPWWEGQLEIRAFRHPVSKQVLVSVAAVNGDPCDDAFYADIWVIFEQHGQSLRKLRERSVLGITSVLDVDADGRLEFLTRGEYGVERELVVPHSKKPGPKLTYNFHGCGC